LSSLNSPSFDLTISQTTSIYFKTESNSSDTQNKPLNDSNSISLINKFDRYNSKKCTNKFSFNNNNNNNSLSCSPTVIVDTPTKDENITKSITHNLDIICEKTKTSPKLVKNLFKDEDKKLEQSKKSIADYFVKYQANKSSNKLSRFNK
jgi:hypothetical protein